MKTSTLLCLCFLGFSYSLAVEDVYEYLWEKNKDIASKTMELDFLRQMENGSLHAERYVNFTIQDIGYLLKVTKMLKRMSAKVALPNDIKNFMKGRYSSYKSFADFLLKQYFFKLADNLNIPSTNAYYTWKVGNMGIHPEKHYKALLNNYLNTPEKVAKANALFRAQIQNEHDFFFSS
uniref:Si:ch1073-67j19.1 n=1 Tax=Sinocyclocheilus grahami TaxID=75366 RepID=A0A672SCC3_SINGR